MPNTTGMDTKTCNRCGEAKSLSDFTRNHKMRDGRVNQCALCRKAVRKRYRRPPHSAEVRAQRQLQKKRYRLRHPEKVRARDALTNAIYEGRITRLPCEVCGHRDSHGHHDDYRKPFEVRWLCRTHHNEVHRRG